MNPAVTLTSTPTPNPHPRDLDILFTCCGFTASCGPMRVFYNVGNSTVPKFTGGYTRLYDTSGSSILANIAVMNDFNRDGENGSCLG